MRLAGHAAFALSYLALLGCANTASFTAPDGSQAHTAKCNISPNACYEKATQTCGGSYRVLDSHSNAGGLLADVLA